MLTEVNFGTLLKRLLDEHGHSQRKLAELTGVSPAAVTKWLTKGAIPQGEVLNKISQLYNVTITGMLKGIEESGDREMQFTATSNIMREEPATYHVQDWASRALLAENKAVMLAGALHDVSGMLTQALDIVKQVLAVGSQPSASQSQSQSTDAVIQNPRLPALNHEPELKP